MTTIRALQKEDDLRDLITLSRDFFDEYEVHHEEFFDIDNLRDSDIVEYFSRSVESEDSATFVAIEEGCMVGYVTIYIRLQPVFYKIKKVGEISGLMVHKDYRRRSIASQLLARSAAYYEEKNVKYYVVYTAIVNQAAIRCYEKHGMTPLYITLIGKTDSARA